jgi:hypothetical protein
MNDAIRSTSGLPGGSALLARTAGGPTGRGAARDRDVPYAEDFRASAPDATVERRSTRSATGSDPARGDSGDSGDLGDSGKSGKSDKSGFGQNADREAGVLRDDEGNKLGEVLTQVQDLVNQALRESKAHRRASGVQIEQRPEGWRPVSRSLLQHAQREFLLASSGLTPCDEDQLEITKANVLRLLRRGVHVRHLFASQTLATAATRRYLEEVARGGAEVRVTGQNLQDTIVIDGRVAVVWGRLGPRVEQCLTIRGTVVLDTLRRLFSTAWESASELRNHQWWFGDGADEFTASIARFLTLGYKDDTAARQLGISVRTYRRYVAEIMKRLDAASRFQAGVRAAQLGLISASPDVAAPSAVRAPGGGAPPGGPRPAGILSAGRR